jgi:hypothetical protein
LGASSSSFRSEFVEVVAVEVSEFVEVVAVEVSVLVVACPVAINE